MGPKTFGVKIIYQSPVVTSSSWLLNNMQLAIGLYNGFKRYNDVKSCKGQSPKVCPLEVKVHPADI